MGRKRSGFSETHGISATNMKEASRERFATHSSNSVRPLPSFSSIASSIYPFIESLLPWNNNAVFLDIGHWLHFATNSKWLQVSGKSIPVRYTTSLFIWKSNSLQQRLLFCRKGIEVVRPYNVRKLWDFFFSNTFEYLIITQCRFVLLGIYNFFY